MYSDNDFRSYLEHAEEEKKKGSKYGIFQWPGGKNSSEYNHTYYINNLWRWGVDAANSAYGAAKNLGQQVLDSTDLDEKAAKAINDAGTAIRNAGQRVLDSTDLDERALSAYNTQRERLYNQYNSAKGEAKSRIKKVLDSTDIDDRIVAKARDTKSAVKNSKAYQAVESRVRNTARNVRSGVSNAVKSAGSRARATYNAAQNMNRAASEMHERRDANSVAEYMNARDRYEQTGLGKVEKAVRNAPSNARQAARNLGRAVNDRVDDAREAINTGVRNTKNRINTAIDNSSTTIDDKLRTAYRSRENNPEGARIAARSAVKEAGRTVRDAAGNVVSRVGEAAKDAGEFVRTRTNRAINQSPTMVDNDLRRAAQKATQGNLKGAGIALRTAGRHAGEDIRNAVSDVRENVGNAASRVGEAARTAYNSTEGIRNTAKNIASGAADTAVAAAGNVAKAATAAKDQVASNASKAINLAKATSDARKNASPENLRALSKAKSEFDNSELGRNVNAARRASRNVGETLAEARSDAFDKAMEVYQGAVKAYGAGSAAAKSAYDKAVQAVENYYNNQVKPAVTKAYDDWKASLSREDSEQIEQEIAAGQAAVRTMLDNATGNSSSGPVSRQVTYGDGTGEVSRGSATGTGRVGSDSRNDRR